jgi:hypothetical protein
MDSGSSFVHRNKINTTASAGKNAIRRLAIPIISGDYAIG